MSLTTYETYENFLDFDLQEILPKEDKLDRHAEGFFEGIDAKNNTIFVDYQERPFDFFADKLGITTLTDDQRVFVESVLNNKVTIAQSATGVGKTFMLALLTIYFYKCYEKVEIYAAAPPPAENLRTLFWAELGDNISRAPDLFKNDKTTDLKITRAYKQHIKGLTIPTVGSSDKKVSRFSGKHQKVLIFIFDEGDAIPDECYDGVEGCMSGGVLVRFIICFNPKMRQGAAYRMIRDRKANVVTMSAFNHPNVVTGVNLIPGAVTREVTIVRINNWSDVYHPKPEELEDLPINLPADVYAVPEFLVGTQAKDDSGVLLAPLPAGYRRITDPKFYYMVLGIFAAEGENQLISQKHIDEAVMRWKLYQAGYGSEAPDSIDPVMTLDVAEHGGDDNMAAFFYGDYLHEFEAWKGVDPDTSAQKAARLFKERQARKALVDAIGVGSGVPARMEKEGAKPVIGVKVSEKATMRTEDGEFNRLRDELYWQMRLWFKSGKAMIPDDKDLLFQLTLPTYEVRLGKVYVMEKKVMRKLLGGKSPDKMECIVLRFGPIRMFMGGI